MTPAMEAIKAEAAIHRQQIVDLIQTHRFSYTEARDFIDLCERGYIPGIEDHAEPGHHTTGTDQCAP